MPTNRLGAASWEDWYGSETRILRGLMGEYHSWSGIFFWRLLRLACSFSAPPLAINRNISIGMSNLSIPVQTIVKLRLLRFLGERC
jgi:hypothetical protein